MKDGGLEARGREGEKGGGGSVAVAVRLERSTPHQAGDVVSFRGSQVSPTFR